ncbi:MAG: LamG-like jellyroll fold domain-containing protein [archaeon]|nr:LamG-like jellyroll fold domain-containing protein [archaeon]
MFLVIVISQNVFATTLVLYHLDESQGTLAVDSSGNNVNGVVTNPFWVQGYLNNGLSSNGINQTYIDPSSQGLLNQAYTEFTIELWFKPDQNINGNLSLPQYLFVSKTQADGIGQTIFWIGTDGRLGGFLSKITGESVYVFGNKNQWTANQWYHVALTFKGTTRTGKIWVDNNVDGVNFSMVDFVHNNAGFTRIGARDSIIQGFNGVIDEVEISNTEKDFSVIDTDSDTIPDTTDNCRFTFNKNQRDYDNDGVGDWCDNCQLTPNADQLDSNENELGDACENCGYQIKTYCSEREFFSPITMSGCYAY